METSNSTSQTGRAHIYEIDLIRAITVFSVVAIHSFSTTNFLVQNSTIAVDLLNLVIHLFHYNREMFIFVTGLVLTYSYFNKPFSAKKFWLKRVLLVFIPYVLWTLIYTKINHNSLNFNSYINLSLKNIFTGNASYQLYYILLALQFYAIFPIFRQFLKKIYTHPFITLFTSFAVQIVFIYFDFNYFQTGIIHLPGILQNIITFQDRIFLTYQFFFILGAISSIYMEHAYILVKKYGRYFPIILIITMGLYSIYYFYLVNNLKMSVYYATSVLQPSVVIYSVIIILFFSWISILWANKKRLFSLIKVISDTSFGIYFVHILALTYTTRYLLPILPTATPVIFKIIFVLLTAFSFSVIFCYLLLRTPLLSWTIGKARKVKSPM